MTHGIVTGSGARLITPRLIRSPTPTTTGTTASWLVTVGKLTDDETRLMGLDGQRALYKMLHCPEDQKSTDRPMLRWIIHAAIDCVQSIFLNGLV